jgi:hypothetical protein
MVNLTRSSLVAHRYELPKREIETANSETCRPSCGFVEEEPCYNYAKDGGRAFVLIMFLLRKTHSTLCVLWAKADGSSTNILLPKKFAAKKGLRVLMFACHLMLAISCGGKIEGRPDILSRLPGPKQVLGGLAGGLVLLLHFDESQGATTYLDSSGMGNNGSSGGSNPPSCGIAGMAQSACSFNGNNN